MVEGGVERQGQERWKGELRDKEVEGGVERQGQERWKGELRDKDRKGGRGS